MLTDFSFSFHCFFFGENPGSSVRTLESGAVGQMDQSVRRLFLSSRPETTAEVLQWKRDSGGNIENARWIRSRWKGAVVKCFWG